MIYDQAAKISHYLSDR